MPKLNQRGVVHLLVPIILLLGIVVGVYLVGQQTNIFPKAYSPKKTLSQPLPSCKPRPACLDVKLRPCMIPEPVSGWCPLASPSTISAPVGPKRVPSRR